MKTDYRKLCLAYLMDSVDAPSTASMMRDAIEAACYAILDVADAVRELPSKQPPSREV